MRQDRFRPNGIYQHIPGIAQRKSRRKRDREICNSYFKVEVHPRLHIGCGSRPLPGWLNADLEPLNESVIFLDATKPLPFADSSFDLIYSEHMIEHVYYNEALSMLRECWRILKPGGIIRIATPCLESLLKLVESSRDDNAIRYIQWASDCCLQQGPFKDAAFVVNNLFRSFGHQFIYSRSCLAETMKHAGFCCILETSLNHSDCHALSDLANVCRMPRGFLDLETMTFEGRK